MAAVASPPPNQDVSYQSYPQDSLTCAPEAEQCIKSNSSKNSNESDEPAEEVISDSYKLLGVLENTC